MLVHSYLTSGFVDMAKVFLQSLLKVHGDDYPPAWLDTLGLSTEQICVLNECYPADALFINNRRLSMDVWAKRAGISKAELKGYKRECEQMYVTNRNRVWKLMTAGDDRVHRLFDMMRPNDNLPDNEFLYAPHCIAHFDIDTLFRKPLISIVEGMMEEADIWLKLRPNNTIIKARITIDCILLRPTDGVVDFFDKWTSYINRVKPAERPIGYGQTSCWLAFQDVCKKLKYKTLPLEFGLPGRNAKEDLIWTGNVHKLSKKDCAKLFRKEMKSWKL